MSDQPSESTADQPRDLSAYVVRVAAAFVAFNDRTMRPEPGWPQVIAVEALRPELEELADLRAGLELLKQWDHDTVWSAVDAVVEERLSS